MFVFVLCCSEHLEGLSYCIWWECATAFLSGNLSRPAISQSEQVFLQLLFFFHQQPRPGRAFFVSSTVSKHNIKRCHLTQSKDVQTREEKLRILKASATSHESEIEIQTSMGLNTSMHIREDDHNAIKRPFKLLAGPNRAVSCAGHDIQSSRAELWTIQYKKQTLKGSETTVNMSLHWNHPLPSTQCKQSRNQSSTGIVWEEFWLITTWVLFQKPLSQWVNIRAVRCGSGKYD